MRGGMQKFFCGVIRVRESVSACALAARSGRAEGAREADGCNDGCGRVRQLLEHLGVRGRGPEGNFGFPHRTLEPGIYTGEDGVEVVLSPRCSVASVNPLTTPAISGNSPHQ